MKIKALKAFTVYDSQTKDFLSIGHGQIAEVDNDLAEQLISAALAEKVTEGSGGSEVVKGLVERNITNITADMLAGITSIGDYAFYNCDSLTSIIIPSGVTSIGEDAFSNCNSLTSVEIPSTVASTGKNAFYLCSSLTSVEISSGVTSISSTSFYGCSSLENITIPSTVTSILNSAFMSCNMLESITVLATNPPTLGADAFNNTSSGLVIYVPAESVDTYKAASGWSDYSGEIEAIPAEEAQS